MFLENQEKAQPGRRSGRTSSSCPPLGHEHIPTENRAEKETARTLQTPEQEPRIEMEQNQSRSHLTRNSPGPSVSFRFPFDSPLKGLRPSSLSLSSSFSSSCSHFSCDSMKEPFLFTLAVYANENAVSISVQCISILVSPQTRNQKNSQKAFKLRSISPNTRLAVQAFRSRGIWWNE